MKFKMVSYFVPNDNEDFKKLTDITTQINKQYCEMHRYDYQLINVSKEQIIEEFGEFDLEKIVGYKLKLWRDQLDSDCDYLAFIDTDAAVSNPDIKLEDLIDDTHSLFFSRGNDIWYQNMAVTDIYKKFHKLIFDDNKRFNSEHWDTVLSKEYDVYNLLEGLSICAIGFNQGFMIFRNTQIMKDFLDNCLNLLKTYTKNLYTKSDSGLEGKTIRFTLAQKQYKDIWTHMPEWSQGGLANVGKTKYSVEKTFIMHNYGEALNIKQKISLINTIKKNKWWKKYNKVSNSNLVYNLPKIII